MKEINKLKTVLLIILVLNISDDGFTNPSVLDVIKTVLLVIALVMVFRNERE